MMHPPTLRMAKTLTSLDQEPMKTKQPSKACWCGSGSPYESCHATRGRETSVPRNALAKQARKLGHHGTCLHYAASKPSCSPKIIDAHTVQRSRELRKLMNARCEVLMFDAMRRDAERLSTLTPVGWKNASTFSGFCAKHDAVFAPVENTTFTATPTQCLLLAYRAVCYELHTKRSVAKANPRLRHLLDRGHPEEAQRLIQSRHRVADDGNGKGLEHFASMKAAIDEALSSGIFQGWRSTVLWFTGPLRRSVTYWSGAL